MGLPLCLLGDKFLFGREEGQLLCGSHSPRVKEVLEKSQGGAWGAQDPWERPFLPPG